MTIVERRSGSDRKRLSPGTSLISILHYHQVSYYTIVHYFGPQIPRFSENAPSLGTSIVLNQAADRIRHGF